MQEDRELMKRSLVFRLQGCTETPGFLFCPGHPQDRAFEGLKHIPHRSAQSCNADRSAASPDLLDILSGDNFILGKGTIKF